MIPILKSLLYIPSLKPDGIYGLLKLNPK